MVLQHNLPSINARRHYNNNTRKLNKSLEKLSSGYAINRAGDNAAGLAVSEKMRSMIGGMKQAVKNSMDGISLIQTFEGALGETVAIIHRMKTLADQSANGTYDNEVDRVAIQTEFTSLGEELDQIADTDFNGLIMLNGRRMADKFTFLTEDGVKWLAPSGMEFNESSYINTFPKGDGVTEMTMSMELLPGIWDQLTNDKELLESFKILNKASVKMYYENNIPQFSLEGLSEAEQSRFSIEYDGSKATISAITSKGKVGLATVTVPSPSHNATTSATGKWVSSSVASGSYTDPSFPDGITGFMDASKYNSSYVGKTDGSVTRAEREAYMDWISKSPNNYAELVADLTYDKDTNEVSFYWKVNDTKYTLKVDENGIPQVDPDMLLPIYPDDYDFANHGPQIYIKNFRFTIDDEDVRITSTSYNDEILADAEFRAYTTTHTVSPSTTVQVNGQNQTVYGGSSSIYNHKVYYDIWLDHGNVGLTYTYNKNDDNWTLSFNDSNGNTISNTYSWNDLGLTANYYARTEANIASNLVRYNLSSYFEPPVTGQLPDGFTLTASLTCPMTRTTSSSGTVYSDTRAHTDTRNSSSTIINDFKLAEYDPEHPEWGYVDWEVAQNGASYTYDGVNEVWRDNSTGNAVNLEDVGIYLPENLDSEVYPLHDGMTITVSNPSYEGYIQAKIDLINNLEHSVNPWEVLYENVTYSDNLILQVGGRTKDAVNFTFSYNSDGIGDLIPDLDCTAIGLGIDKLSLLKQDEANYAIDELDHALNKVSMIRATFGAVQNRLEHKIDNLNVSVENLTASESQIRDTDMPTEMMNFTKNQILAQASQSMLAQANQLPQSVLSLLNQ